MEVEREGEREGESEVDQVEERERVMGVLETAGALEWRARTMAINDFLALLVRFSEAGYRFSGKQVQDAGVREEE